MQINESNLHFNAHATPEAFATTDSDSSNELEENPQIAPKKSSKTWQIVVTALCRGIVGATFIFSGFAKAIDPWGSIYKIQEYLDALGLHEFIGAAVPETFLLFILEFLVGIFILFGCYKHLAPIGSFLFMIVMLPLTLWIALKNPVADCGCFGDALQISNWASFWKNVGLMAATVWLMRHNRNCLSIITPAIQWIAFCISTLFILIIGWIGYMWQPLIDFRPYKVGNSLSEILSSSEENGTYTATWKRGQETITLPIDSVPGDDWEFVDRQLVETPNDTPIEKDSFAVYTSDEEDVSTDVVLDSGKQIIIVYNNLSAISPASYFRTNSLYNYCTAHDVDLVAFAAATSDEIDEFRDLSLAEYPIYIVEDTALKQMVRGNPAVVYLEDGVIKWKSALSALYPNDFMSDDTPADPKDLLNNPTHFLPRISLIYIVLMLLLSVLSMIPKIHNRIKNSNKSRFVKDEMPAVILLLSVLATGFSSCSKENNETIEKKESTTLIYMIATNSLTDEAVTDLEEIRSGCADVDLDKNNLLIYYCNITSSPILYQAVNQNGTITLKNIVQYSDNEYSTDPERLTAVVKDTQKFCPALSYGLVLWSHATGWAPAFAPSNRSYGDDYGKKINIPELASALPDDFFNYIWCDCCFMGGIESAYELRNKCNYFAASPTEIMGSGLPYKDVLKYLASPSPQLREAMSAEYDYYSTLNKSVGFTGVIVATDRLATLADEARKIVCGAYPTIDTTNLQLYGSQSVKTPSGYTRISYYDLQQVFARYAEANTADITTFTDALNDCIVYKVATPAFGSISINPDHFSGLSVYIPLSSEAYAYNQDLEEYYRTLAWSKQILSIN